MWGPYVTNRTNHSIGPRTYIQQISTLILLLMAIEVQYPKDQVTVLWASVFEWEDSSPGRLEGRPGFLPKEGFRVDQGGTKQKKLSKLRRKPKARGLLLGLSHYGKLNSKMGNQKLRENHIPQDP